MMDWSAGHWVAYTIVQSVTAIAYYVIPITSYIRIKAARDAGLAFAPVDFTDSLLFRVFVAACGTHHATHPVFMYFGFFWPMMAVDISMAAVSAIAAIRMAKGARVFKNDNI